MFRLHRYICPKIQQELYHLKTAMLTYLVQMSLPFIVLRRYNVFEQLEQPREAKRGWFLQELGFVDE